jgi:hypothetical protein
LGVLAVACAVSIWPVLASQSVPAFQQDWTWPLSRPLALQWLHAFVGLWDPRSLGQANALPWQTYAVIVQVACIVVFGPSIGLGVWIVALQFGAACTCFAMLGAFGVRSVPARFTAALFYALGPVAFTRIAAGHLAYVLAYALLPLAIAIGRRTIEQPSATAAVALGVVIGFAACQVQFLVIAWLAVLPLAIAVRRASGWPLRLAMAAVIAVCMQLQALLPLLWSSTATLYLGQRALLSFEYNNSAPWGDAPVMLGYFTRYYQSHALPGAYGVLYFLLIASVAIAVFVAPRPGLYALIAIAIGTVLTAGLYGPLSSVLAWSFEHTAYFAVFRDLHYFAALTAAGTALALGLSLQRLPRYAVLPALALVVWIVAPTLTGSDLREIVVPRPYVDDALADMKVVEHNGPGRVLWLPAEEPLGLHGANNQGRDFTAYGPAGNPSVSDDYQNPQLAYALATLRAGKPDWNAFAMMNVRYLVFRAYVRSGRMENFGIGFPMAFAGRSDAALGRALERVPHLSTLRRTALSSVYELPGNAGERYVAQTDPDAMLYSELAPRSVAVEAPGANALGLDASALTADPRIDWVLGTLGWRYRPWLPDSIYPFVWTLSARPLHLALPALTRCVVAGALPRNAILRAASSFDVVRGSWKRYRVAISAGPSTGALVPAGGGVSAIVDRGCTAAPRNSTSAQRTAFVFASGYDAGWRAVDDGRLVEPALANGWMMAWNPVAASERLLYLPSIAQLAGILLTMAILGVAVTFAKLADSDATARERPRHR